MGLNSALATAGRSLEVFSAGLQVAGQNIANATTPGYIREELQLQTNVPFQRGRLIFGTGVFASGIQQQIDQFLEARIHTANSDLQASNARTAIYLQLESEIRELGDGDLSTTLNQFLASINEVVNQPESGSLRQLLIQQAGQLTNDITSLRSRIDSLRATQSTKVETLVEEANQLIDRIVRLNPQISKSEASGLLQSDNSSLRSQRYDSLSRLSEIIPIRYDERPDGSVDVFTGSDYLILAGQSQHLETVSQVDRNVSIQRVRLASTGSDISTSGGELGGIIEGRDQVLGGFVDELDLYTFNLISEFNRLHSSGEGLRGFTSVTSDVAVTDQSSELNAAGLDFTPVHGSFQLKVTNTSSDVTETTNISIDLDGIGADTSLDDLRTALDAVDNISASISTNGRLQIVADNGFEVRFADDSSGVLAALGINTFFTGSGSTDIGLNSVVQNNHEFFAASQGGGPSDGQNAVRLAEFIDNPVAGLGGVSLNDFYDHTIASIAQESQKEAAFALGFEGFQQSLLNQREQFSGVSLDEEAIKVIQFQRSFQAAARIVSTIDELFTILLNM